MCALSVVDLLTWDKCYFWRKKFQLCGRHLTGWLVDLVVRGKKFQTVVAFHQLTYLFAASWNMCVRFFWLTGWLWILSKMTKLTTAWFTSPNIVCALSVVDWLTWDMSLFGRKKNSTVWPFKVVLIGGWLVDLWFLEEKNRLCGRHLACWLVDLVVRGKNFQTVVSFHDLSICSFLKYVCALFLVDWLTLDFV